MGLSDPNRGISLRFPRFIKIRDDKGVYDATSAQQVKDMYEKQQSVISGNGNGNSGGIEMNNLFLLFFQVVLMMILNIDQMRLEEMGRDIFLLIKSILFITIAQ